MGCVGKTSTWDALSFLMVLAPCPSHPHPTSLSRMDSILRWVLPTGWRITAYRDRHSPTQDIDGRSRSPPLVTPTESTGGVQIGPGVNQSLWSGTCDALIGQLGTQAHPQGQELPTL